MADATSRWDRRFDSHADFYAFAYGQEILASYAISSAGAVLIEAGHGAGDVSDAPSPDLILGWTSSRRVNFSCDLGAGRFLAGDRPNDIILTAPDAGSSIQADRANVCRVLAIPYGQLLALAGDGGSSLPADGDFGRLHAAPIRDNQLLHLLNLIWREGSAGKGYGTLATDGLLLQIAARLLQARDAQASAVRLFRGGLAPHHLRLVLERMEADLAEDLSLKDLAALTGLSTFYFCRAFRASTGMPPHRWRYQRRLEHARFLLAGSDLSVTEVSAQVGYGDPSNFAAAFRKSTGAGPREFRRNRRT